MSSKKTNFLGIDLSSTSIKVVELMDQKKVPKLVTYGYAEYSGELSENDSEEKLDKIAEVVKKICQEARTTSRYALSAMPGISVFSSIINLPKMSRKDLESAIYWEAKKFIPMELEDVVLDWKILDEKHKFVGMSGKGLSDVSGQVKESDLRDVDEKKIKDDKNIKILLTAAPRKLVEQYVKLFKKLNFELLSLETESFAMSRALVGADPESVLIVDLGAKSSSVMTIEAGIPVLSRSIEIGGNQITKLVADKLNISTDRAEQFKRDLIFDSEDNSLSEIRNVLDSIIQEINDSLTIYDNQESKNISRVILTGGMAGLGDLTSYFSKALNKTVVLGNPWEKVIHPKELTPILNELAPRFAISLGLAMREID